LTLRGTGRERTIIKSKEDGEPVFDLALIDIQTEDEITVVLGRLTVTGAKGASGVVGVRVGGKANVTVSDSQVFDNGYGLLVMGSATVSLTDSQVSGNGLVGLSVGDEAQVTVEDSFIEGNGTAPNCNRPGDFICNGISVSDEAHMELRGTTIRNNTGWGVAAFLKQCGYNEDVFAGTVTFEGENTIESNNTSGNHNGKGNPGNHPFKNLPDGQVCLP